MKQLILSFFLLFSTFSLYADKELKDPGTGEVFPSEITIDHDGKTYKLGATGVATRKIFFIKIYSIASYLEGDKEKSGPDKMQTMMSDNGAKELDLKWVHDAPLNKLQSGFKESFDHSIPEQEIGKLRPDIDKFISLFTQDVKKGDEHILRWFPGGQVDVIVNGKTLGTINNPDFAKGLWTVWFGPKSVVNRDQLVAQMQ
jgi:hypothetical protein